MAPPVSSVPSSVHIHNMTGVYTLNRTLSDPSTAALKQQNIGFLLRQAIERSSVEMTLKGYTGKEDGKAHVDQVQVTTGNMRNEEERVMDWEWRDTDNWIWGKVKGRNRYIALKEVEDEYLSQDWEEGAEDDVVEGMAESLTDTWSARQIWGFANIDGVRRHVRRILAQKPGTKDVKFRMVYDWRGEVKTA